MSSDSLWDQHIFSGFQGKAVSNCNIGLGISSVSKVEIRSWGAPWPLYEANMSFLGIVQQLKRDPGGKNGAALRSCRRMVCSYPVYAEASLLPWIQILPTSIYSNYITIDVLKHSTPNLAIFWEHCRIFCRMYSIVLFASCLASFQNILLYQIFIQIQHLTCIPGSRTCENLACSPSLYIPLPSKNLMQNLYLLLRLNDFLVAG